jgi:hypothetical protein
MSKGARSLVPSSSCSPCRRGPARSARPRSVGPRAGEDGRPILWKNRDTDVLSNRVVFVKEAPYSYLGLADLEARSGRSVYVGVNAAGFAIMNSVAYNLPKKAGESEDREGFLMADALRTCRTAADFEALLKANLGRDLGARANFGVIDAEGAAVLFEVHSLASPRTPEELAGFQDEMAAKALETLRSIRP